MIDLRVVHLLSSLHASAAVSQGINLGRWLRAAGHEVLLVSAGGEREADAVEAGIQPLLFKGGGAGWWLKGKRRLLKEVEAWQGDLIHVLRADDLELGLAIADHCRLPLVASVHGVVSDEAVELLKRPQVALVLVPNDHLRSQLVGRRGLERDRVGLLPYGLDLARYPVPEPRPELRTIGGLFSFEDPEGGAEVLLAALRLLAEDPEPCRPEAVLYGSGDREALGVRVAESGLGERVRLVASQPHSAPLLAGLDVVVYPARRDSHPIGVLKALALARPVVASAVGSMTELIQDGETGLLVPPDDAPALAAALRRLLTEVGLAARLGAAARQRVADHHGLDLIGEAAHGAYRGVLRGGKDVGTETITAYRNLTSRQPGRGRRDPARAES